MMSQSLFFARLKMLFRRSLCLGLIGFIIGCGCESSSTNSGNSKKGTSGITLKYEPLTTTGSTENRGAVTGQIRYRADVDRPWFYGKYYLSNNTDGDLSEAVVSLSSRQLSKEKQVNMKPKTWEMNQKNHTFTPPVLAIQLGDNVKFKNSDQVTHNVNAVSSFDSFNFMTPIADAETHQFNIARNEKESVKIRCNLHAQMHAQIFVFGHPYFAITQADGHFEFQNVPAGEYFLVVMHHAGGLQSKEKITVTEKQTLLIEKTMSADDLLESTTDNN